MVVPFRGRLMTAANFGLIKAEEVLAGLKGRAGADGLRPAAVKR